MKPFFIVLCCVIALFPGVSYTEEAIQLEHPRAEVDHWFDDALFIGDSLTRQLHNTVMKERHEEKHTLGKALMLASPNYTIYNATRRFSSENVVNIQYRGLDWSVFKLLKDVQPAKVFILLGMNDGMKKSHQHLIVRYAKALDLMAEAAPDAMLVVQALTPVTQKMKDPLLQQDLIDSFNASLASMCAEKGVYFLDIATPLKGEDGFLPMERSTDQRIHLNLEGIKIWVDTLHSFAQTRLQEHD